MKKLGLIIGSGALFVVGASFAHAATPRGSVLPFSTSPAYQAFTFTDGPQTSVNMIKISSGKYYLSQNCQGASGYSCLAYSKYLSSASVPFEADSNGMTVSPATTLCTNAMGGNYVVGTLVGTPGIEEEGFCVFSDNSYISSAAVFQISNYPADLTATAASTRKATPAGTNR